MKEDFLMFGLLEKVAKTVWDTTTIPIAIAEDIVSGGDKCETEDKMDSIVNNLEDIFTGDWDDDK